MNSSKVSLLVAVLAASAAAFGQSSPAPQAGAPAGGAEPWSADNLIVTPQRGQSGQQLWADRYACDAWAKTQSGYDSSRPAGGGIGAGTAAQVSSYRAALIACLQAKGYGVRAATQSAAPPAPAETPPPGAPESGPRHYLEQVFEPASEFQYRPLAGQIEGGYTVTQGQASTALRNGWNGGLGITWSPIAALPFAFRIDGSYSRFDETNRSLQLAAQRSGASGFFFGHGDIYGGDTDAQIDLKMGPTVREYFFGGIGWYREQTVLKQVAFESGERCFFFCVPGYVPVVSTLERSTTDWLHSWNAGMGFEFALAPPATFFVEARYLSIGPSNNRMAFVPIRFGLRF
jgi:hypothetical protein